MIYEPIMIANKMYKTIIQTYDEPLFDLHSQPDGLTLSLQEFEHAIFTPP